MGKDLVIRSSTEEFITFKVQEKDKDYNVTFTLDVDVSD